MSDDPVSDDGQDGLGELLLRRVDETAGPNYQPASRVRGPRG